MLIGIIIWLVLLFSFSLSGLRIPYPPSLGGDISSYFSYHFIQKKCGKDRRNILYHKKEKKYRKDKVGKALRISTMNFSIFTCLDIYISVKLHFLKVDNCIYSQTQINLC